MYILEEEKAKYEALTTKGKKLLEEKKLFLDYATDERNIRVMKIVIARDEDKLSTYDEAMKKVLKAKDATKQILLLKKLDRIRNDYEGHLHLAAITTASCGYLARYDQGFKGTQKAFLNAITSGNLKKYSEDE